MRNMFGRHLLINDYDCFSNFIHHMFGRHVQIDDNNPSSALARERVDAIKKTCKSSGLLKRRFVE
jgi:farnesyl-diphosphate farnesyltransferase